MKRGLVEWDRQELPEGAFAARLAACRAGMCEERLDALLVYTDVWRAGHVRFLSHYLPYWSSGLLVLPLEGEPLLRPRPCWPGAAGGGPAWWSCKSCPGGSTRT
ncbi:MAG: hypothetical protein HYY85_05590 [Deltaproteobacteria bacterium]|nr:hypothetical protein [Deltaproteobacteria bacterium]